jgi:3-phosphoglycerate kinase
MSLAVLLAVIFLLSSSTAVKAEEITCQGFLGAVTVDNLRVPPHATCTLAGTTVLGTIKVEISATLYASNVSVIGNVQAENAARVEVLPGSVVSGSIQIVQSGAARIDSVQIGGDLYFDANRQHLWAANNHIGGNLQAFQNTGGLNIANNVINGNLQCKENVPLPVGGNNTVHGNKEDQCTDAKMLTRHIFLMIFR